MRHTAFKQVIILNVYFFRFVSKQYHINQNVDQSFSAIFWLNTLQLFSEINSRDGKVLVRVFNAIDRESDGLQI